MTAIASKQNATADDRKLYPATLAEFISAQRKKLGASQGEIAVAVGKKSGEWLGMIESRARPLQLEDAPRLADALKLDRNYFCKLVLKQYYPTVFSAIFPEAHVTLDEMKKTDNIKKATGKTYVAQVAMDLYEKIQALPQASRITVMNMIDQMFSMHTTNTRRGLQGTPR